MQTRWNTLVDAYILESGDPRPPKEIERAAKIGTWGGALFRVCEGVECGKAEGREIENLKLCSRCQIVCAPLTGNPIYKPLNRLSLCTAVHIVKDRPGRHTKLCANPKTKLNNHYLLKMPCKSTYDWEWRHSAMIFRVIKNSSLNSLMFWSRVLPYQKRNFEDQVYTGLSSALHDGRYIAHSRKLRIALIVSLHNHHNHQMTGD